MNANTVIDLALAAGRLVVVTDGEERFRAQRQAVLDALDALAIADRSPLGPRPQGSVHESGGAEGNRTNPVLLHKRSD